MKQKFLLLIAFGLTTQFANAQWSLTGNAGTNANTNFIGTTDNVAFKIRTQNKVRVTVNGVGNVGIGTSTPTAKLHITSAGATDVLSVENKGASDITAVYGRSAPSDYNGTGGYFEGGFNGCFGVVYSHDVNNTNRYYAGTVGEVYDPISYGTNHGSGVVGQANGNLENTGVFASASAINPQMVAYGIHAYGNVSGGGTAYAGFFEGNVTYTGILVGPSDIKLKENIQPLSGSLDLLMKLKPASYDFRVKEFSTMNLPQGKHFGLIAQETESVIPDIITNNIKPSTYDWHNRKVLSDKMEFKGVNYMELIPLLISGMQEQQKEIEVLKSLIANNQSNNGALKIFVSDEQQEIMLGQNIPNPFDQSTIIPFRVPKNCNSASIMIAESSSAKVVTVVPISCNETHLMIEAGKLSSGTYTYTLYVDGKQVDSKQMIISK